MARQLRIQYEGAVYHIVSRGNRREPIFRDDEDRRRFVEALGDVCRKTGWCIHAYVLMTNHIHLVVETPQPNLVEGMRWLLGTYTARFNRRHGLVGHLFAGRYKSLLVDASGGDYLRTVCDYVHLNPARAGLLLPGADLAAYPWSSWRAYLAASSRRPPWLRVDRLLGAHGVPKDSPAGRRRLAIILEARRDDQPAADYAAIRRGWCLGDESFRAELLQQVSKSLGPEHFGAERRESDNAEAERIIRAEFARLGWQGSDLKRLRKGDPEKVRLALRLRAETVMPIQWIAQRLSLGSRAFANHLLWRAGRNVYNNKN